MNKTTNKLLFVTAMMWVSVAYGQTGIHVAPYYGYREAAISYTFDDGLLEHYTLVFPKFKELGLKGSFCIIGSKVGKDQKGTPCMTWEQLKEMADDGQEITSHGFRHQSMEKLTDPEALRYEVQHNDTLIFNNVGKFPRTYFFPGNRKTSEGLAFTQKDRVGTRTSQVSFGSKRDSLWMEKWVAGLLKKGEWGVTMTHGITTGYDCFPNPQVFWNHLEQVSKMQDRIWVATFHDVAAYVAERDTVSLDIKQTKDIITITPSMPLDDKIFFHPLTLVIDGNVIEATQDKKKLLLTKKGEHTLFDFDPNGGKIIIKLK
jgi:peptidoglycan/xylan/chitin deacetylase (PgdA/CDA1 family)